MSSDVTVTTRQSGVVYGTSDAPINIVSSTPPVTVKAGSGPRGAKGEKGDKGDKGDTGAVSTTPGPQGNEGERGQQGIQGIQGSPGYGIDLLGEVATPQDLPDPTTLEPGNGFVVTSDGDLYVIPEDGLSWVQVGQIVGPQGIQGFQGVKGEVGSVILSGEVPPDPLTGRPNDYYVDSVTDIMYGPKIGGAFAPPVSGYENVAPNLWYGTGVYSMGNKLRLAAGQITGLRFYRNGFEQVGLTRSVRLYTDSGTLLATSEPAVEPVGSAWVECALSEPLDVTTNQVVVVAVDRPAGYTYGNVNTTENPEITWIGGLFSGGVGLFPATDGGTYTYGTDVILRPVALNPWPVALESGPGPQGLKGDPGEDAPQHRGAWSPVVTYTTGEIVTRGGSSWTATISSTGIDPAADASRTVIGSLTAPSGLALGSPQAVAQTFTVDRDMTVIAINALAGFTNPPYDGLVGIASAINVPALGVQWMGKADPDTMGYALLDNPVSLSVGVEYWYVMKLSQANVFIDQGTDLIGSHVAWGNDFWYGSSEPSTNFGGTYGIPFILYGSTADDAWQLFVAKGDPGDDALWVQMTQAAYDALPVKDPGTLYVVVG